MTQKMDEQSQATFLFPLFDIPKYAASSENGNVHYTRTTSYTTLELRRTLH